MADKLHDPVAAAVRAELARANISAPQLARDLNLTYRMVITRLNGEVSFKAEEIAAIALYLGVPIERLYGPPATAAAS